MSTTTAAPVYLRPAEAAARIGVSVKTIADWRLKGTGPTYVRLGDSTRSPIRYPEDELAAYLAARTTRSER